MTNQEAASALQAAADKNWESDQEMVAADPIMQRDGDLDFYRDDHTALTITADLIRAGELEAAYSNAATMDTAVREVIPPAVWVHIGGELLHG